MIGYRTKKEILFIKAGGCLEKIILDNLENLNDVFKEYFTFVENSGFEQAITEKYSNKIINIFNISPSILNKIRIENNIQTRGVYLKDAKEIVLNVNYIIACLKMNFIDKSIATVEYLTLLLHEIIHCIQQEYIRNNSNFKKDILFSSEMFRFYSCNDIKLQPLFPDEINANLLSVLFINQLIKLLEKENLSRYCEKQLIYYLTLGLINNESINSQLKYLYKHLLNVDYEEKFDSFNQNEKIIYGVTKSDLTMEKIFESYRTQKLCLDIKMKGGKR